MKTCKRCGRTGTADEFHGRTCVPCYNTIYREKHHRQDYGCWAHNLSMSMITKPLRAESC